MEMAEYIKRMDTFSDEMCEGIDCGVWVLSALARLAERGGGI